MTQDGPDDEAKAHMGRGNIIGQGKGREESLPSASVQGSRVPGLLMQNFKAFNVDLGYGIASKWRERE